MHIWAVSKESTPRAYMGATLYSMHMSPGMPGMPMVCLWYACGMPGMPGMPGMNDKVTMESAGL